MAAMKMTLGLAVLMIVEYALAVEYSYYQAEPEHYAPAKYSFEYAVKDEHTGDIKSQHEVREGDSVKGYYTLVQPDGKKRIVEYTADKKSGFNAIVHYEGEGKYYSAPKYSAPVATYVVPEVKYEAPAPVYKYEAPTYKYEAPTYKYEAPTYKYEAPSYKAYSSASVHTPHYSYKIST
uniref:Cuticular protein n=1 Tax=Nilaparvata lugens TaxID=108931 RepID=A0A2S1ZSA1_NILLU|nr:cuticular protein [Nilaparvata lugens]